jgi:trehalose 6-phosphate phosphatase
VAGVEIEDKALTLAIHYRRAPAPAAAARAIRAALAAVAGVRVIGGKRVVNVLPAGLPDKGSALAGLRRRLRAEAAVYVGDDETDEDVFALRPGRDLVTIRVGPCRTSRARYFLRDQDEVDTVLALLVAGRRPRGG